MKRITLTKKFVAIFLFLLVAVFLVLLLVVQVIANTVTQSFVNNDVLNRQLSMAEAISDVLDEVNNSYTRIVSSERLGEFSDAIQSGGGKELFCDIINDSSVGDKFVNVTLKIGDNWYSFSDAYDLPANSFANAIATDTRLLYFDVSGIGNGYLYAGRRFQNSASGLFGVIVFYLNCQSLNGILSTLDEQLGYTFVTNSNYTILARSDGKFVGLTILEQSTFPLKDGNVESKWIDGERCIVATRAVTNQYQTDWYVVSVLYYNVLQKDLIILSWVLAAIALGSLVFATIFAITLARRTVKPLNQLSQYITEADVDSAPREYLIGQGNDELDILKKTYDEMIAHLKDLMEQNKINMDIQRKLEIDSLQMQINPHFLYNTLDAIAWMAKIKKQPEIEKLVIDLARFFRLSLHKGDKFVTVSDEVELIYYFVEIQKVRFPNTLALVCDVQEEIAQSITLKLILQPIVENSIKHGFVGNEGVGTVTVKAYGEGEDIIFEVSDDGVGFDVPQDFWQNAPNEAGGYGLRNVNERIRLEYGAGYGLTIKSEKGKGTCVTVRIKKRRNVQ